MAGGLQSPREGRHSTAGGTPGSPSLGPCPGALRGQAQRAQVAVPRCSGSDHSSLFTLAAHLLLLSPAYPGCCYEISLSA